MNANDIALTQVDRLGFLLAQIAELTKEADAIKDTLKDTATKAGAGNVFEGNLFKATIVEANRKVTDWKAIAKVCKKKNCLRRAARKDHHCCVDCCLQNSIWRRSLDSAAIHFRNHSFRTGEGCIG